MYRLNTYPSMAASCAHRVKQTRLRRRMLEGMWADDLRKRLEDIIDPERLRVWGPEDITKNNFRSIVHQLATLYDKVGSFTNAGNEESGTTVDGLLKGAGWWQLAIRHQRYVVGLRESLVRVSVLGESEDPSLQLRLVTPDLVELYASMDTPDEPHTVIEYRARNVTRGNVTREEWTRDYVSVQGGVGVYRIESENGKEDLTAQFRGPDASWPERWNDSTGAPVLPFVLYHAERTGKLTDAYEGVELVDGSLNIAALWTYWNHIVRACSHPQRAFFNAQPMGGVQTTEENGVRVGRVTEDPASILLMEAVDSTKPASAHQFQPGGDPEGIGRAIRDFAANLALDYGISPTDIDRTHGNAQSGYAVALSRDGIRQAQRRHEPEAARGDAQLARVVAVQWNRATGSGLAEDGYTPHYKGLEDSLEEKRLELERLSLEMDRGLISPVDVYMRLHDVERNEAMAALQRIRTESAQFRQLAG